jgi:iron complex outermembrane receptor protein
LDSSRIKWIAGAFFFRGNGDVDPIRRSGSSQAAAGGYLDTFSIQQTTSLAAFAQVTVPLTSQLQLTGGLRYTYDRREISGYEVTATGVTRNQVDNHDSWSEPTWRVALDYHPTDDVLLYASYNRGFKSGIYSPFSPNLPAVEPEILDAYEVGVKTQWLDRRLRLNVAGFYYRYDNIQLIVRSEGVNQLFNAAEAEIKGVDVEILAAPIRNLTLRAGLTALDPEYQNFPNAPANFPSPATCGPPPVLSPGPRTGGNTSCEIDASGNRMILAPDLTFNVGANLAIPTPLGELGIDVNYYYNSGFYWEPDNRVKQPSYGLLGAQVSLQLSDQLTVRVWGRNLTDVQYPAQFSSSQGDFQTAAAPRTLGFAFDIHF